MSAAGLTPAKRAAITAIGFAGLLGVAWTIVAVLTSSHASPEWLILTLLLTIGSSFTATGMYAWARRPDSWFGLQLSAVGLAWFATALAAADDDLLFTIGVLVGSLYAAVIVHALLGFPTGRLRSRGERVFVVSVYLLCVVGPLLMLLVTAPDPDLPRNVLLVDANDRLADVVDAVLRGGSLAAAVGATILLVLRWRRATAPERRLLAPVLWSGAATTAGLALSLTGQLLNLPGGVLNVFDFAGLFVFASIPFAFVTGIVRANLSRGQSVGRLVARLGDAEAGRGAASLRDALAIALHDRSLAIAYWMPAGGPGGSAGPAGAGGERDGAGGRYVDAAGQPVALPEPGSGRSFTEVEREGRRVAAIVHDASLDEEPELVRAAGAAAALALENERLDAELRVQIAEVRASRKRLLEVVTRERRRIERDLHDGAQQRLVALALTLGIAEHQVASDPEQAQALIREARDEARLALEELRELARGIHPAILTDRGLGPALEALASRAPLPVELADVPAERLPPPVEGAAYFVVAEALANVAKYAAASHAEVIVQRVNGHAVVEVRDDGVGGADPEAGTGLRGLEDRLSALDGRLAVFSPSGRGTTIRAEIPCTS